MSKSKGNLVMVSGLLENTRLTQFAGFFVPSLQKKWEFKEESWAAPKVRLRR